MKQKIKEDSTKQVIASLREMAIVLESMDDQIQSLRNDIKFFVGFMLVTTFLLAVIILWK